MLANVKKVRQWHQLCNKEIDFSLSWEEWKEYFNKAQKAHEIIGLLHHGFDAETYERVDEFRERIFFYLEMAYGYNSIGLFSLPEDRRDEEMFYGIFGRCTVSAARKKIAQKAWAMLCQKLFENTEEKSSASPSWWWIVKQDSQILDKILWFFSEKDNIPSGSIYKNKHNNRIAFDFLYTLAQLAWIDHLGGWSYGESPLPHFVENRPKFIKILGHLRKLDFLEKEWRKVTKQDMRVLEEMALLQDDGKKKFKTIDEVAVDGSQYAQALIVLRALLKENARQEKIAEAEIEIKEAEKKIEAMKASL